LGGPKRAGVPEVEEPGGRGGETSAVEGRGHDERGCAAKSAKGNQEGFYQELRKSGSVLENRGLRKKRGGRKLGTRTEPILFDISPGLGGGASRGMKMGGVMDCTRSTKGKEDIQKSRPEGAIHEAFADFLMNFRVSF